MISEKLVVALLAAAAAAAPFAAYAAPWDPVPGDASVIAAVSYEHFPTESGRNVSIDRVDRYAAKIMTIGVQATEVADSQWALLHLGGGNSTKRGISVNGGIELGPGKVDGQRFVYKKMHVDASFPVAKRWSLTVGDSYVDVRPVTGHSLGAGFAYADPRGVSVQAKMFSSVSGNVEEWRTMLRVDYRARPPYFSGGIVVGESNNSLVLNLPGLLPTQKQSQGFIGIAVPLGRFEVGMLCDIVEIADLRRETLSFSVRMPVKRRE